MTVGFAENEMIVGGGDITVTVVVLGCDVPPGPEQIIE